MAWVWYIHTNNTSTSTMKLSFLSFKFHKRITRILIGFLVHMKVMFTLYYTLLSVFKAMSTPSLKYFIVKKWQLAPKLSADPNLFGGVGWELLVIRLVVAQSGRQLLPSNNMTVKSATWVETSLHERVLCNMWCCLTAFNAQCFFLQNCNFLQSHCWLIKSLTNTLNSLL